MTRQLQVKNYKSIQQLASVPKNVLAAVRANNISLNPLLLSPKAGLLVSFIISLSLFLLPQPIQADTSIGDSVTFACSNTEATIAAKSGPKVTRGESTIYVGYQQFGDNKDPIIAKFTAGTQDWCHTDYEVTPDDSTGYGLFWDETSNELYGVFSSTGTQGTSDEDFRRFATSGWLKHYTDGSSGGGGGAKVAIVARINPNNGDVSTATFITALLSSQKTNSMQATDLMLNNENLVVRANSWYSPRNPDKTRMSCEGDSPFDYTLTLSLDLSTARDAYATGCLDNTPDGPTTVTLSPTFGFVGQNRFLASVEPPTTQLPITFTWQVNDSIVRNVAVMSLTDSMVFTWSTVILTQTVSVSVTNARAVALGQPAIEANTILDIIEAKRLYLPLLLK